MTLTKHTATATATALMSAAAAVVFTAAPASANTCSVTPKAGVGAVSVRTSPSTSSSSYSFTLYPGEYLPSSCSSQAGGYYTGCGNGTHWVWVQSGWFDRYVAAGCVRIVVDRVGT